MKVRIEMEVDLFSGAYDVRFHNLTRPGEDIDVTRLTAIVHRVLDSVAVKGPSSDHEPMESARSSYDKHDIN